MFKLVYDRIVNGLRNKVTSTVAFGFLVSAAIQVGYNFDADAETKTDWGKVQYCFLAAVGFVVVPDAVKSNSPRPSDDPK